MTLENYYIQKYESEKKQHFKINCEKNINRWVKLCGIILFSGLAGFGYLFFMFSKIGLSIFKMTWVYMIVSMITIFLMLAFEWE